MKNRVFLPIRLWLPLLVAAGLLLQLIVCTFLHSNALTGGQGSRPFVFFALTEALVGLLGISVIVFLLRRWLVLPLRDMEKVLNAISSGDISTRLPITGTGELVKIASTINAMQDALLAANLEREKNVELARISAGELLDSETRFRAIIDASPVPMAINDDEKNIIFLNSNFIKTFGYTLASIPTLEQWWPKAYPDPEYRNSITKLWNAELERSKQCGDSFRPLEVKIHCQDGTVKTALVGASPLAGSKQGEHIVSLYDITERKKSEEAIRSNERFLNTVTDAIPMLVAHVTKDLQYDFANKACGVWFDLPPEKIVGSHVSEVLGDDLFKKAEPFMQGALQGEPQSFERVMLRADDTERDCLVQYIPDVAEGRVIGFFVISADITSVMDDERALQLLLKEKEALLKEVHHRVKNNLQVIASLLRLESARSTEPGTQSVMNDMRHRVQSMALLHGLLYRSRTFSSVDLGRYTSEIIAHLIRAIQGDLGTVKVRQEISSIPASMDQAMPCGLLISEVLTNCLKHAFPDGRTGEITVSLQILSNGTHVQLQIADNGIGLPADQPSQSPDSLGLQLISDLTDQLGGTLDIKRDPGTAFTIIFPTSPTIPTSGNPPPHHALQPNNQRDFTRF